MASRNKTLGYIGILPGDRFEGHPCTAGQGPQFGTVCVELLVFSLMAV